MKLSLYLLAEDETLARSALRVSESMPLEEIDQSALLSFPHIAFIVRNKTSRVTWAENLRPYFELDDLQNVTNSFVLLFEVAGRVWAITYGQGFHVIDPARVEIGFGLRVVANCIDPESVRSADVRTSDALSRLTRAQISAGADIRELGIAVDNEMVRHLAGRLLPGDPDGDWARSLSGADALQIEVKWPLEELQAHCTRILARYESDSYKNSFSFIDNFTPLKSSDPRVEKLTERLLAILRDRVTTKIAVAAPEIVDSDRLDHYRIWRGRSSRTIDLTLDDVYDFLDVLGTSGQSDALRINLMPVDDAGSPVGPARPLDRYLAVELSHVDQTYVLASGQWYEVDDEYLKAIDRTIKGIRDLTSDIRLPALKCGKKNGKSRLEREADYNVRVANEPTWTLLDRKNIPHGGPHQRIEAADLVGLQPARFIHVKKMTDSATLSHLWAQGAVSAELYQLDTEYRDKVLKLCPGLPADMSNIEVVYAIATERGGSLADELFFFSKVHLAQNLRSLRMIGCRVGLAKIPIVNR